MVRTCALIAIGALCASTRLAFAEGHPSDDHATSYPPLKESRCAPPRGDGDPNRPIEPWGNSNVSRAYAAQPTRFPALVRCEAKLTHYTRRDAVASRAGSLPAGIVFELGKTEGNFVAVSSREVPSSLSGTVWVETSQIEKCQRAPARWIDPRIGPSTRTVHPLGPAVLRFTEPRTGRQGDLLRQARIHERHARYDLARDNYRMFAELAGGSDELVTEARKRAIQLSLVLGDLVSAEQMLDPTSDPSLVNDLASALLEIGDEAGALRQISQDYLLRLKNSPVAFLVRAHVLRARALKALGQNESAVQECRVIIQRAGDIRDLLLSKASDDDIASINDGLAEAYYFLAELKRHKAEEEAPPKRAETLSVEQWTREGALCSARWRKLREERIYAAADAYKEILEIVPAPPPRWVIAASTGVGTLWASYLSAIESLPIPEQLREEYERSRHYYSSLGDPLDPLRAQAKNAFELAVALSRDYRIYNENTLLAERWLAKNYPAEHHMLNELTPRAVLHAGDVFPQPSRELSL